MTIYDYKIDERAQNVGGGFRLRLLENDVEVGGGVFPLDEYSEFENPQKQAEFARLDAENEGQQWVQSRGVT